MVKKPTFYLSDTTDIEDILGFTEVGMEYLSEMLCLSDFF
jgi:hypothetical protein